MRTDLSEKQVAKIGRLGCAAVNHALENEGGVIVESSDSIFNIIPA